MKRIKILLVLLAFVAHASAQTVSGHRYRGFVDATFLAGNDGSYDGLNSVGGGFSTSHGYQFNPYIFVGGGVACHFYSLDNFTGCFTIPVFSDFRVSMNDKKISPYFDAKLGYSLGDYHGFYASPSFGVRFGLKKNKGVNVSVGYTAQEYDYTDYFYGFIFTSESCIHSLTLSVGLDF